MWKPRLICRWWNIENSLKFTVLVRGFYYSSGLFEMEWYNVAMMRKATSSDSGKQTPFTRFMEAGKHIFNIPQTDVKKIKASKPGKIRKEK